MILSFFTHSGGEDCSRYDVIGQVRSRVYSSSHSELRFYEALF